MKNMSGLSLLEVMISFAIMSSVLLGLADVLSVELKDTELVYQKNLIALKVHEKVQ